MASAFPDFLEESFNDYNFFWSYITPQEIRRVITKLTLNAVGTDGLSFKSLRPVVLHYGLHIFEHLFNCSLEENFGRSSDMKECLSLPYT